MAAWRADTDDYSSVAIFRPLTLTLLINKASRRRGLFAFAATPTDPTRIVYVSPLSALPFRDRSEFGEVVTSERASPFVTLARQRPEPASTPMLQPTRTQLGKPATLTKPGPYSGQDFCVDGPIFLVGNSVLISRSACHSRVCAHADEPPRDRTTSIPNNDRNIMSDAPFKMAPQ